MYIRKTDKEVVEGIFMSVSSLYNKKIQNKADTIRCLIQASIPEFKKLLNLPAGLRFRIAPIKGRFSGRYNDDLRLVELDSRLNWDHAMLVLAHELVHAEQFHENRLENKFIPRHGYAYFWNGKRWNGKGSTLKAYMAQPWEKEAYERQTGLVEQVCTILDNKHYEDRD